MTTEDASKQIRIDGVRSVPRSVFEREVTPGCAKYVSNVANRLSRDQFRNVYSWIDTEEMFERQHMHIEQLLDYDSRFAALNAHTGKVQQRLGVTVSTRFARKEKNLTNPMDNDIFMRSLRCVMDELKHGLMVAARATSDVLVPRVLIKKNASVGHGGGGECIKGPEGALWTHEKLTRQMLASPDGIFKYEKEHTYITTGARVSANSVKVREETGEVFGKERLSLCFPDRASKVVVGSHTTDGSDGFIGMRPRHVNAIPRSVNLALMAVNALYMDNLTDQLKAMWKFDIPRLAAKFVGGPVHCIDFEQFEATQPRELRHYVAEYLYSPRVLELVKHIDNLPIAGAYTDFSSGDHNFDLFLWIIDRHLDPKLAEEFSPLLSGTGDTALMGKVLGTAAQLAHYATATGLDPEKILVVGGDANTIAALNIANLGDDQANGFRDFFSSMGATSSERRKILDKHVESIEGNRYFSNAMELDPPKIAGAIAWLSDVNDMHSDVIAMSHDPVSFLMNRLFKEQDVDSPLRGDEVVGLHGALSVYEETLVPVIGVDQYKWLEDVTLDIINCPHTRDELAELAPIREREILENGDDPVAVAHSRAMQILGLTNISELDYMVTKEQKLALPPEVLSELWITIDPELVSNYKDFVSV